MRLRTDNGQTVPQIVAGDTITLRLNSTTILSGTFAGFTGPTPSPSPTGTPGPTPSPSPSLGRSFESHLTGAGVQPPVQTAATGEIKPSELPKEKRNSLFQISCVTPDNLADYTKYDTQEYKDQFIDGLIENGPWDAEPVPLVGGGPEKLPGS